MTARMAMVIISLGYIAAATILEIKGFTVGDQVLLSFLFGILAFFR